MKFYESLTKCVCLVCLCKYFISSKRNIWMLIFMYCCLRVVLTQCYGKSTSSSPGAFSGPNEEICARWKASWGKKKDLPGKGSFMAEAWQSSLPDGFREQQVVQPSVLFLLYPQHLWQGLVPITHSVNAVLVREWRNEGMNCCMFNQARGEVWPERAGREGELSQMKHLECYYSDLL